MFLSWIAFHHVIEKKEDIDTVCEQSLCKLSDVVNSGLFYIEDLAESRHIENALDQRLEITDDQLATLCCNVLVQ